MVVCKMEARLEYAHVAYTFFCTFGAYLHAKSVLSNKISASELSRKFIVGWACGISIARVCTVLVFFCILMWLTVVIVAVSPRRDF